jgi:hypothetical protein
MKKSSSGAMAAVLVLCLASASAAPSARAATVGAAAGSTVKHSYDPRNLDGVWHLETGGKFGPEATKDGVKYIVFPFTREYQASYDKRLADAAAGNPYQPAGTTCKPSGAIRLLTGGGPLVEIFHTPTKIAVLKENGGWSRIYLNRGHLGKDDLYPMFYGDSIGHWDGDTLVVDTISLGGANNIDGTAPHSKEAHLLQRISRPSFDTLRVEATLSDPEALTHPVSTVAIHKLANQEFAENFCQDERNILDEKGKPAVKF